MLIGFDTLRACVHVVMTAGLVTGQFLIYGWIKEALNAPPGVEIHKEEK
jgi:solute carrier family 25 phosphate transporter 3